MEKVICIQINNFFVDFFYILITNMVFVLDIQQQIASLELTDRTINALNKQHNTPLNIFLDHSEVFDHTILLDKLLYYGVRGTAYNLLKRYPADREQFHKFRNNKLQYYIQNWQLFQSSNTHNHNTRGANALHKNICIHVFAQKSLKLNITNIINAPSHYFR